MSAMLNRRQVLRATAGLGVAAATSARVQAQTHKRIDLLIGYTPGGSYDLYARLVARHLGRFLPGEPTVVPQNMPGAGSLRVANFIFGVAPKDGSAIGIVTETVAIEQALSNPAVQYDAAKFTWIGRVASSINVQMVWNTSPLQSIQDAYQQEVTFAGTGPGNIAETIPRLLNGLLGMKVKVISGYPASNEGMLAMERGEVDGSTTSWTALKVGKQDWLREKKIKLLLQDLPERDPELADVPCLVELGRTEEEKQVLALYASGGAIGRSIMAPPGLSADVTKTLRSGFMAMTNDPEFKADIQKTGLELAPQSGEAVSDVVVKGLNVPDQVRERARSVFSR
jgi:tripartite-type tricarboxylate transporter receptor subunit TctC